MTKETRSALRRIGWGLVICLIDLHIQFADILPEFIGYAMILSGLVHLDRQYGGGRPAMWLAGALVCLSLPSLFIRTNVDASVFREADLGLHIYNQFIIAIHVLLVYRLFSFLYTLVITHQHRMLLDMLRFRRNFYMVIAAVQLVLYPFFFNIEDSWLLLMVVIGLFMLLTELMLIRAHFRLSRFQKSTLESANEPQD